MNLIMFIVGFVFALLIIGFGWLIYEIKTAPEMPDDFDISERKRPNQSENVSF